MSAFAAVISHVQQQLAAAQALESIIQSTVMGAQVDVARDTAEAGDEAAKTEAVQSIATAVSSIGGAVSSMASVTSNAGEAAVALGELEAEFAVVEAQQQVMEDCAARLEALAAEASSDTQSLLALISQMQSELGDALGKLPGHA
jgi:hypothetical protein